MMNNTRGKMIVWGLILLFIGNSCSLVSTMIIPAPLKESQQCIVERTASLDQPRLVQEKKNILQDRQRDIAYWYGCDCFMNWWISSEGYLAPSILPNFPSGSDIDSEGNWYAVDYTGGIYQIYYDGYQVFVAPSIPLHSLTYDPWTELWYGCDSTNLYIVDITTGETSVIGPCCCKVGCLSIIGFLMYTVDRLSLQQRFEVGSRHVPPIRWFHGCIPNPSRSCGRARPSRVLYSITRQHFSNLGLLLDGDLAVHHESPGAAELLGQDLERAPTAGILRGKELDQLAGLADLAVDLGPLGHTRLSGPRDPLDAFQFGDGQQRIEVIELAHAVQMVERIAQLPAGRFQLGPGKPLEHLVADHEGEIALEDVVRALAVQRRPGRVARMGRLDEPVEFFEVSPPGVVGLPARHAHGLGRIEQVQQQSIAGAERRQDVQVSAQVRHAQLHQPPEPLRRGAIQIADPPEPHVRRIEGELQVRQRRVVRLMEPDGVVAVLQLQAQERGDHAGAEIRAHEGEGVAEELAALQIVQPAVGNGLGRHAQVIETGKLVARQRRLRPARLASLERQMHQRPVQLAGPPRAMVLADLLPPGCVESNWHDRSSKSGFDRGVAQSPSGDDTNPTRKRGESRFPSLARRVSVRNTPINGSKSSILPRLVVHGHDVLQGRDRLEIVARGQDVSGAVRGQGLDAVAHLGADLLRRAERQDLLVLDAAVEADPATEVPLQRR